MKKQDDMTTLAEQIAAAFEDADTTHPGPDLFGWDDEVRAVMEVVADWLTARKYMTIAQELMADIPAPYAKQGREMTDAEKTR